MKRESIALLDLLLAFLVAMGIQLILFPLLAAAVYNAAFAERVGYFVEWKDAVAFSTIVACIRSALFHTRGKK